MSKSILNASPKENTFVFLSFRVESRRDGTKSRNLCFSHRHVNNVCYIEWALESVPPEVLEERVLAELEIHFLAEALFGEEIISSAKRTVPHGGEFHHGIARARDGQELVRARTVWTMPSNKETGIPAPPT